MNFGENKNMEVKFTPSQQRAFDVLDEFCKSEVSKDKNKNEIILTGSPGYGKSFLIKELKNKFSNIVICATTNKAANLINGVTIYSFLGLTLKDDYTQGKSVINYDNAQYVHDEIVVVDECSMINKELFYAMHTYMQQCKIIYVGDYYQLPPVNNDDFSIFNLGIKMLELTEPCRTDKEDILKLINTLKSGIDNQSVYRDFTQSDNIKIIDSEEELNNLLKDFDFKTDKCLSYTNKNVESQNYRIRELQNKSHRFGKDDYIVCKSAVPAFIDGHNYLTKIESVSRIVKVISDKKDDCSTIKLSNGGIFKAFLVPFKYTENLKTLAKIAKDEKNPVERKKKWGKYFDFKNHVLDIRDIYASTVHSAQGSTYNNVYIDLKDLFICTKKEELARLLYVAVSRAKNNIYLINL